MTQRVAGLSFSVRMRPVIQAAAYLAEEQVGATITIDTSVHSADPNSGSSGKARGPDDAYVIQSLKIVDEAKQNAELILSFFDVDPVGVGDGVAIAFDDDELQDNFLGHVKVEATDYVDYSANSVATLRNVGLQLKTLTRTGDVGTQIGDDKIYCVMHTTGTPTYGATDALGVIIDLAADI